jgi:hypothetical protein
VFLRIGVSQQGPNELDLSEQAYAKVRHAIKDMSWLSDRDFSF